MSVTDEQLIEALRSFKEIDRPKASSFLSALHKVLDLTIQRLIETSDKFNSHQHDVSVRMSGSEYDRAGDGTTSLPAGEPQGFGCGGRAVRIGE